MAAWALPGSSRSRSAPSALTGSQSPGARRLSRSCRPRAGAGLARCQAALAAAGCRSEYVLAADGGYLAVLAPRSGQAAGVQ